MKKFLSISFIFGMLLVSISCNAQTNKKDEKTDAPAKVEAYYFHFTARCYTCRNVEAKAKESLESLYGDKVTFQSVNLDEAANKALADRLQVYGQTLLIVKGETKINLTNEGFMYANSNPEKFKSIIKEKVDLLMQ